MHVGVDFDNTVVCYDGVLYEGARERGWIPASVGTSKTEVRDYLRRAGQEDRWTELQGLVYGPFMSKARPFPGVRKFFAACRQLGIRVSIISHRTRTPYLGQAYDLHQAAADWLLLQGFTGSGDCLIEKEQIFFEVTKEDKMRRIAIAGCTHFIDDLPEFLTDDLFPAGPERILFDPADRWKGECGQYRRMTSWQEISGYIGALS